MASPRWLDADGKEMAHCPYAALDAFPTEHRLCRPGLDDPHVADAVVALWCAYGARIAVRLPAEAARRRGTVSDNARPEPPRRRIKPEA